jgi:hypothetical protein
MPDSEKWFVQPPPAKQQADSKKRPAPGASPAAVPATKQQKTAPTPTSVKKEPVNPASAKKDSAAAAKPTTPAPVKKEGGAKTPGDAKKPGTPAPTKSVSTCCPDAYLRMADCLAAKPLAGERRLFDLVMYGRAAACCAAFLVLIRGGGAAAVGAGHAELAGDAGEACAGGREGQDPRAAQDGQGRGHPRRRLHARVREEVR